jgi:hypothetical protein
MRRMGANISCLHQGVTLKMKQDFPPYSDDMHGAQYLQRNSRPGFQGAEIMEGRDKEGGYAQGASGVLYN